MVRLALKRCWLQHFVYHNGGSAAIRLVEALSTKPAEIFGLMVAA